MLHPRHALLLLLLAACHGANPDDGGDDSTTDWSGGDHDDLYVEFDADAEPTEPEVPEARPEQCAAREPVRLYLSPDDSNSMASPVVARSIVEAGYVPMSVRPWEFLNYYTFDYVRPEPGALNVQLDLSDEHTRDGEDWMLQIAVTSEARTPEARRPMTLTLSVDASGSMSGQPMAMVQESCRAMAAALRAGDTVNLLAWSTVQDAVLAGHVVTAPSDPVVTGACDALDTGGGTDLNAGLIAAYDLANQYRRTDGINRVVLLSDGGANVGITSADLIGANAADENAEGIYMVGIGVGNANGYDDRLMDTVTDLGKGASLVIPDTDEAWAMLHDRFLEVMDVAARDVEVWVDLPPGFEVVEFSGEQISTQRDQVDPQHLAPNDTMVFHQSLATSCPELVNDDTEITVTVSSKDPYTYEVTEQSATQAFGALLGQNAPQLWRGAAITAYAQALEDPRSEHRALQLLGVAEGHYPGDPELAEIRAVLGQVSQSR